MSFLLPPQGTAAREYVKDLRHLAELLHPDKRMSLPTFGRAVTQGRRWMRMSGGAAQRIAYVCFGNDNFRKQRGNIVLISVGKRGGVRLEWIFGPATA